MRVHLDAHHAWTQPFQIMRTDGLYAFDSETRALIERILRPEHKTRVRKRREYAARKARPPKAPPLPKPPRPEGRTTAAARLLIAFRAEGGKTTVRAWALAHGVKEASLSSAMCYLLNPHLRAQKNEDLRRKRAA